MSLPKYDILIGGEWQPSASGQYFETHNPFTGKPWALIPRCNEADATRAVEAASAAFERGPWAAMTATQRGALLRKLGDLLTEHAEPLAQTEVRDNGKLISEMHGQTRYLPQWYYYYGGLADKIEGGVIPIDKTGVFNFTRWEPTARRRDRHRAVELAAPADELEARAGAGGGQYGRGEAVRVYLGLGAGIRAVGRKGRFSAWCRQYCHWLWQRDWRAVG